MSNIIENKKQPLSVTDDDMPYVILCQKGDVDAFEILVKRHQTKMLNMAYRMMGDYDDACDVVQEAFLLAFRGIKKYKAEALFSTWLYRIVVNQTKNKIKHLGRLASREQTSIADVEEGSNALSQASASEERPDERLVQQERDANVQHCISKLDHGYRDVLVLRDIQGFSYEEIGDVLQMPEGTVKSRLSRARNALKDCLVKIMGDWS